MTLCFFWTCFIILGGCNKFLEEKSEKSFVIPNSLKDVQALLDHNAAINTNFSPGLIEMNTDDFYITGTVFNQLSEFEKQLYVWAPEPQYLQRDLNLQWKNPYQVIFIANTALERLSKIERNADPNYEYIKGTALFYRAYVYYQLAQVYCAAFRKGNELHNNTNLGLPLRLNPNFEEKSTRSTLAETYRQIIKDLTEAGELLPEITAFATRPDKTANLAMLARVYLAMEEYEEALVYANKAMERNSTLIDYRTINATSTTPFPIMNPETLFLGYCTSLSILNPRRANVDSLLYRSYDNNDLRRTIFFNTKVDGSIGFKGNYAGFYNASFFNGLAVDELYLIKAECLARKNNLPQAKDVLSQLLNKRYSKPYLFPHDVKSEYEVLTYILQERRKELLFRGLRWTDIKRLNKDERFQKVLMRKIENDSGIQTHFLPVDDPKYTFLIPQDVIQLTGIRQNPR